VSDRPATIQTIIEETPDKFEPQALWTSDRYGVSTDRNRIKKLDSEANIAVGWHDALALRMLTTSSASMSAF
jgi:hypothetical protein